jgi:esterase/lipase superfamily enzyme
VSTFTQSYLVTNRKKTTFPPSDWAFDDEPQPPGHLSWMRGPGQYNPDPSSFLQIESSTDASLPPGFAQAIIDDLRASANSSPDRIPRLAVFVHGLATDYSNAITTTSLLGSQLLLPKGPSQGSFVPFSGLVIGFSWPCYGTALMSGFAYGTMRDHINDSVRSFVQFATALQALRTELPGLVISLICHSEGNYMGQQGMAGLTAQAAPVFDRALLLAADLNTNCLERVAGGGMAHRMSKDASVVTVYWNSNDNVLPDSVDFEHKHFVTPSRLGLAGPDDFDAQAKNAPAVDCSDVITTATLAPYGGIETHMGYFHLPVVLNDISQCASGASVAGRTRVTDTNGLGFSLAMP